MSHLHNKKIKCVRILIAISSSRGCIVSSKIYSSVSKSNSELFIWLDFDQRLNLCWLIIFILDNVAKDDVTKRFEEHKLE